MTEVQTDLETGILRLSRARLLDLASIAGNDSTDAIDREALNSLEDAGLVTDGVLHEAVDLLARTVFQPIGDLRLELVQQQRQVLGVGWFGCELSVLAIPVGEGLEEIKACPTALLPARLAEFLDLGPRPRRSGSVRVTRSALDKLEALDHSPVLRQIGHQVRLRWKVTTAWRNGRRSLEILDAGSEGLWEVRGENAEVQLEPTTPTRVWMELVGLLPRDDELGVT
jgi:hypothetical protein